MASLSIDTKDKAEVLILALFNFKPNGVEANIAREELVDDVENIFKNWYAMHPKDARIYHEKTENCRPCAGIPDHCDVHGGWFNGSD